jgi:hypothetical protein
MAISARGAARRRDDHEETAGRGDNTPQTLPGGGSNTSEDEARA